jgi:hypothetical protein
MVKNPTQQQVPVGFVDNPQAPDVFADTVTGIAYIAGVVRLTFESARVSHVSSPGPVNRVVIGRLILPLEGARNLKDLLIDYIGKIDAQGGAQGNVPPAPGTVTIQ